ncbi:UDP-Glycosyltransferase/glycogen phosphorylase [Trametes maxima]|nr:UDP-Glycosyltransferase/glycogen phosphorylase [Trametes maxima]
MFQAGAFKAGKAFSAANVETLTDAWYQKSIRRFVKKPEKFRRILRKAMQLKDEASVRRAPVGCAVVDDAFNRSSPPLSDEYSTVAELARSFAPGEEAANRVRLVSIGGGQGFQAQADDADFEKAWATLSAGRELVCAKSFFAVGAIRAVKELSGDSVQVFAWMPGSTYNIFHLFGPEKLGGRGAIRIKVEQEAKRSGRPFEEVVWDVAYTPKGEVVQIPALPPMYDYEHFPQDYPFPRDLAISAFPFIYETLEATDGIFLLTAEPYEPGAVEAVRKWFGETGRPTYVTGPLLPPPSSTAAENEKKQSKQATEIGEFLDSTLNSSGERSLLYISWGSLFWPMRTPEKIWAFLDVVMELDIPFILSHASPVAVVPDEIKEKVKAYGKGLLSPWSPQQTILEHPATGWFLSHGGHNGVTEAICAGIPFIIWPFGGDQPLNAVHISEQLEIGYELIEARSGLGMKPRYRDGKKPVGTIDALKAEMREVLGKAFGPDGAEKRKRLQKLSKAFEHEWEEGGSALRDVSNFLDGL